MRIRQIPDRVQSDVPRLPLRELMMSDDLTRVQSMSGPR